MEKQVKAVNDLAELLVKINDCLDGVQHQIDSCHRLIDKYRKQALKAAIELKAK